jgi:TRAP-type C4-dicarboxylate transport system permease small subunit
MRSVLDRIVGGVLAVILGGMTLLVFVSVLRRYVLNNPMTWSEEAAQLLFAWLTFLGAYIGFRARSHIMIDTLIIYLPRWARQGLARIVDLCVLVLLGTMVWQGISLVSTTWSLEFPAMQISRGYLYLSLPVGAICMFFAILMTWRRPTGERQGQP